MLLKSVLTKFRLQQLRACVKKIEYVSLLPAAQKADERHSYYTFCSVGHSPRSRISLLNGVSCPRLYANNYFLVVFFEFRVLCKICWALAFVSGGMFFGNIGR